MSPRKDVGGKQEEEKDGEKADFHSDRSIHPLEDKKTKEFSSVKITLSNSGAARHKLNGNST